MTLADTVNAMVRAGCSAEQIRVFVADVDEARRAKARTGNRQRQASFRERRNENNAVTNRDGPLAAVTGRDGALPRVEARASVPYGAEIVSIPPSEATPPQPPLGADDKKRGKRISPDWKPDADHRAEGRVLGLTNTDFIKIAEEFLNFWLSESGVRARKLDWDRTFLNRLRDQAPKYSRKLNGNHGGISAALGRLDLDSGGIIAKPPPLHAPQGAGAGATLDRLLPPGRGS